ncbi:MAG TPA: DoxX family protein [Sediminibacterium sp.]
MERNNQLGLLLTRVIIAGTMLVYGISKLFSGIGFIEELMTKMGLPSFLGYGVYVGEIIAPCLILIGFRTRLAALVFAINCLTAILLTQLPSLFTVNAFGGWSLDLLAIYLFTSIALFFSGGGKYAVSATHPWD